MTTPDQPVPRPGPLEGMEPLNVRTRLKLLRLTIRHIDRYTASVLLGALLIWTVIHAFVSWAVGDPQTPGELAIASTVVLAIFVVVGFPLGQALMIARWRRKGGWAVGYFDDTATLLVHPEDGAWALSDHLAEHRGEGIARPFRQKVFAHLAAEADRLGVPIVADTTVRTLADLYMADEPTLELQDRVGHDWCRRTRYQLRREPRRV